MNPNFVLRIAILSVLLFFSGFFSASETALMSLSKIKIRYMIEEKVKGAELVGRLLDNPSNLLGAILVGNNVVNIGASALATSLAIDIYGNRGVGIATGIMTLLVLIFGEITPKSLAAANSEKMSIKVSPAVLLITKFLSPIVVILTVTTGFVIRLFGGKIDTQQPLITEEELKTMVDVGHEEGVLAIEERKMIHNVFRFGDSLVREIMIPRMDIEAVDVSSDFKDILEVFRKELYTRIPVYENTIDNIIGFLHIKDVFFQDKKVEQFDIKSNLRKTFYTFENKRIVELFEEMRKDRFQLAVVVDEYGGTSGIITIQDLVDEIFGDFGDEYGGVYNDIENVGEGNYVIDGLTRLNQVNEVLGTNLSSEHFETIGGYITGVFGHFPQEGEAVVINDLKFIVLEVTSTRIKRVKLKIEGG
ncbi:HlyC/CorC family transporter [Alkalicella caledoniensis]|uniref:HlyC/CorC family transporter n=1 Tax=Alkalicella caledoniensis TaxID=2731377 RepID=A0A7G9W5S5_ALKCA|nr:hemolysin family protein [Alkalicella caledoniensis]QNO14037.1 HlyC/CorC family transporter [Alkalicella caledoniensis]